MLTGEEHTRDHGPTVISCSAKQNDEESGNAGAVVCEAGAPPAADHCRGTVEPATRQQQPQKARQSERCHGSGFEGRHHLELSGFYSAPVRAEAAVPAGVRRLRSSAGCRPGSLCGSQARAMIACVSLMHLVAQVSDFVTIIASKRRQRRGSSPHRTSKSLTATDTSADSHASPMNGSNESPVHSRSPSTGSVGSEAGQHSATLDVEHCDSHEITCLSPKSKTTLLRTPEAIEAMLYNSGRYVARARASLSSIQAL